MFVGSSASHSLGHIETRGVSMWQFRVHIGNCTQSLWNCLYCFQPLLRLHCKLELLPKIQNSWWVPQIGFVATILKSRKTHKTSNLLFLEQTLLSSLTLGECLHLDVVVNGAGGVGISSLGIGNGLLTTSALIISGLPLHLGLKKCNYYNR